MGHHHEARRFYTSNYSAIGLNHENFVKLCHKLSPTMREFLRECNATHVVVRGSSGTSVAFGIKMLGDFPLIVARKAGESSHGSQLSAVGDESALVERYIILDDFMSSGATVLGIMQDMMPAQLAGVLTYNGALTHAARPHTEACRFGVPMMTWTW